MVYDIETAQLSRFALWFNRQELLFKTGMTQKAKKKYIIFLIQGNFLKWLLALKPDNWHSHVNIHIKQKFKNSLGILTVQNHCPEFRTMAP